MRKKKFNQCLDMLRNGDSNGLKIIYNDYYKGLMIYVEKLTSSYYTARKIVPDFLKFMFDNAKSFPYIKKPKSWIKKQIENYSMQYIRTKVSSMDINTFPKHTASQKELANEFEKLTAEEKEIAILHYGYGYSFKRIARIIELPVKKVQIVYKNIFLKLNRLRE